MPHAMGKAHVVVWVQGMMGKQTLIGGSANGVRSEKKFLKALDFTHGLQYNT